MPTVSFLPTELDLAIYAGDDFRIRVDVKQPNNNPVDLTGDLVAQIRVDVDSPTVVTEFHLDDSLAAQGILFVSLDQDQTRALDDVGSLFVYDIEFTDEFANTQTLFAGNIIMTKDVSRSV